MFKSDSSKWIGIILTIVALAVGAAVWASGEHTSIINQTRNEMVLKENADDRYAIKEDTIRNEEKLDTVHNELDRVNQKIDNINNKLDDLLQYIMTRGNNWCGDDR